MINRTQDEIIQNWPQKWNKPMVSIRCIAYNHERYISKALDGILMQKTIFPFEIIIHDDASTDRTASIIKDYEVKYPKIIKVIYESENQYSKHNGYIFKTIATKCSGKYIANCEGDDYWTDCNKLEKQIAFMEKHPDVIATTHNFSTIGNNDEIIKENYPSIKKGFYSLKKYRRGILPGQTATLIFRNDFAGFSLLKEYQNIKWVVGPGDRRYYFLLASHGSIYCFADNMSCYRHVISSGSSFSANRKFSFQQNINYYAQLYEVAKNKKFSKESIYTAESLYLRSVWIAFLHNSKIVRFHNLFKIYKNLLFPIKSTLMVFYYYLHNFLSNEKIKG